MFALGTFKRGKFNLRCYFVGHDYTTEEVIATLSDHYDGTPLKEAKIKRRVCKRCGEWRRVVLKTTA